MKHIIISTFIIFASHSLSGQDSLRCMDHFWTEDKTNLKIKEFALTWHDRESWEARAQIIKKGILEGMQWDKMPEFNNVELTIYLRYYYCSWYEFHDDNNSKILFDMLEGI